MKNTRTGTVYFADFDRTSNIRHVEKMDADGYALITSDKLQWAFGWIGSWTTRKWQHADRIIINKSNCPSTESNYELFNLDKQTNAWASLINWGN